jgi:uncharacterized protein YjiS (DUF1127 family)
MTTQTTRSVPQISGLFHSISQAWDRYRKRRAAVAELQALGSAELERMVQDAGLTFGDVLELAKQSVDSATLRDMQRCCSLCDSKAQCAHELEDHPKVANWPDYCPNRLTIEALGAAKCH